MKKIYFLFYVCVILALLNGCMRISPAIPVPVPSLPSSPSPVPTSPVPTPLPLPLMPVEERYAPILYFDSKEKIPLTSIDAILNAGVDLMGDKAVVQNKLIAKNVTKDILAKYPDPVVNIGGDKYELMLDYKGQITAYVNEIYFNKKIIANNTYIQYWFTYSLNDIFAIGGGSTIKACGNHEGEWEHIAVKINNTRLATAKTDKDFVLAIDEIYFAQHARSQHPERKFLKPTDMGVYFENTHVKVFVAAGTHASYNSPSSGIGYYLVSVLGTPLYDQADGRGQVVKTHQGRLVDLNKQPWINYGGRWGKVSHGLCSVIEWFSDASNDGPLGPAAGDNKVYFERSEWYNK